MLFAFPYIIKQWIKFYICNFCSAAEEDAEKTTEQTMTKVDIKPRIEDIKDIKPKKGWWTDSSLKFYF